MRLTLRTLLAWLDDTLSPAEVRQIGQQVAESPFAQELVEKIHRVTRQRRLTVPNPSGPDATDPNLVADYLDNALDPDEVAEYEKRCLTSDVHLAEVTSVHQILSLIGQKAKVPAEARQRMYQLVKGREAAGSPRPKAQQVSNGASERAAPWLSPELARRPWWERFGPAIAVVTLVAMLGVSAYRSIGPTSVPAGTEVVSQDRAPAAQPRDKPVDIPPVPPPPAVKAAPEPGSAPLEPDKDDMTDEDKDKDKAKAKDKDKDKDKDKKAVEPVAVAPLAKGVGLLGKTDGILLRYNDAATARRWEVVAPLGAIRAEDRLVGLVPYRIPLQLGTVHLDLARGAEVRPHAPEAGLSATFELVRGRAVVQADEPGAPIGVGLTDRTLTIAASVGVAVGLERIDRREPGDPEPLPALAVFVPEGEVTFRAGNTKETVTGPASLLFRPPGITRDKTLTPIPAWVTETAPNAIDQQVGAQFAAFFKKADFPTTALAEAVADDQKDMRRLGIQGLGLIGDYGFLVDSLSAANDPTSRRASIAALRSALGQSAESARKVREAFQSSQPPEWARTVEKLLIGFSAKEAKAEETVATLVKELESPDVGIRELALENLRFLTGRDRLDYDPDKPEGDGLKAWKDLLREKKLRPQPASKPR